MRRIVVVRAGALGDVILTVPAVRALRLRYPEARIEVVGYPDLWEIAGPLADRRISVERPVMAGLLTGTASPDLLAWLRGGSGEVEEISPPVDLAVCWTKRDCRAIFQAAGIVNTIQASPFPPPGIHATAWYLQTLDLPYPASDESLLNLSPEEREAGRQVLSDLDLQHPIILHPGAGAVWKRWPAGRFGDLAWALHERGHDVALLEGPTDREAIEATLERGGRFPIIHTSSVRLLAGILAGAELFVGNDSGATHLAAAAGIPTLALFGPTDPANWAPLGTSRVIRTCTYRTERQGSIRVCEDPNCMEGIAVTDVLAAIEGLRHEV